METWYDSDREAGELVVLTTFYCDELLVGHLVRFCDADGSCSSDERRTRFFRYIRRIEQVIDVTVRDQNEIGALDMDIDTRFIGMHDLVGSLDVRARASRLAKLGNVWVDEKDLLSVIDLPTCVSNVGNANTF